MIDLMNYGMSRFCMEEAGDDAGGSGGGAAEGGDAGGSDAAGDDAGSDDAANGDANEDSKSDGSDAKGTGEGDDKDKTADNDKAKDDSDDDAEKSKDDDDKGDEDDGTTEPLTAEDFEFPEGVEVDEVMMNEFLEIANNKELSPKEQNQALVGLYAQKQQDALDAQYQSWDDTRNAWKTEAKADKEIGGPAFEENLAHAQKALSHFGSKELQEFGEQYGWADHPEYLRMMVRVGKTLSEDNSSGNKGGGNTQTPIESRWYGTGDKK